MRKQLLTTLAFLIAGIATTIAQTANIEVNIASGGTNLGPITFEGNPGIATSFNFNGGVLPTGWTSSPYTVGKACDTDSPDNTNYFWAMAQAGDGTRYVETNAINVSDGGTIKFYIRYGADDPSSGCEDPDQVAEEVILQYSTNGGSTWTTIYDTWDVDGSKSAAWYSWYWNSIAIPAGAQTSSTKFRWYQAQSSSSSNDNWGLEDVSIGVNVTVTSHSWEINSAVVSTSSSTLNYTFPSTGSYDVYYAYTTSTSTTGDDNMTYIIKPSNPSSITATSNPICSGSNTALTANGAQGTVYWYTGGCGSTEIGSGNSISVSPASTTTYYARNFENGQFSPGCASITISTYTDNFSPGAISTTGETICYGSTPSTTIGNSSSASGGDNNFTYSWRSSADGYTNPIPGATNATYLPSAALTSTTSYRRYANDNRCNTTPELSSGTWTVNIDPLLQYRTKQDGNWNNASNWEQFNGSAWENATTYPGEITNSCPNPIVYIDHIISIGAGSNITIPNLTINNPGLVKKDHIAKLTISGNLEMKANSSGGIQIVSLD